MILNTAATGNLVAGNFIGTNAAGTAALGNTTHGVEVTSSDNTIGGATAGAGNLISGNGDEGVEITGSGTTGNTVEGNLIGTDVTGTAALGNGLGGVEIDSSASGNTIGGITSGAGNVISGNTGDGVELTGTGTASNVVLGNLIGTNAAGTSAIANGQDGVEIDTGASGNIIGGTTALARNIISGNTAYGVGIDTPATDNVVEGDYIGTNVTGDVALANTIGVYIHSSDNTIGGTVAGAGNLISGNTDQGVDIAGSTTTDNVLLGNKIGTDITGSESLGNRLGGVYVYDGASHNTIGGTTAGARNLISGNVGEGVGIFAGHGNVVEGNWIGTNVDGTQALGNTSSGVVFSTTAIRGTTSQNAIGGTAVGAGNVISGNGNGGIFVTGGVLDIVAGNLIGTNAAGTAAVPNAGAGITIDSGSDNTIGGTTAGNVVSGNTGAGIDIDSDTGDLVIGNKIGTNAADTAALANGGDGVEIDSGASNNSIGAITAGAGNTIAYNTNDGVQVEGTGTTGNAIRGNSIFANGLLGIELGTSGVPSTNVLGGSTSGPNDDENYPVLTIVSYTPGTGTTIAGNINTTPKTAVSIDLYTDTVEGLDGYGQGQTYIGSVDVVTTNDGNASFTFLSTSLPRNAIVSATATDPGNTSEFSLDQAEDTPPIAALVARPSPAGSPATTFNEDQTIHLRRLRLVQPRRRSLSYTWDFNDGTPLVTTSTPTETHSYDYDGTYVVTLTVNDGHGGIESNIDILTINKLPPTITLNPLPASIAVGTTLNLSGTIDDPTPDLETVVVDWGDGSNPTTLQLPAGSTSFSASHDYASPLPGGATTATISATVTDASNPAASPQPSPIGPLTPTPTFDVGGSSGSTSATLTVFQQAPTVGLSLSQSTVNVNGTVTLSGTIVDPNPLLSHTVTIGWGDTPATTTLVLPPGDLSFSSTHQYLSTPGNSLSGSYTIGVTVVNSDLLSGGNTTSVTVVDVSPVVQIESLPLSTTGSLVSLIADATEPGTLNQLTYQWTLSTGGALYASGTGQTLSFVSISGGVFTAQVVVTDQDGATGQASAQVVISPSTPNNTVTFNPAGAGLVTITANGTTSSPFAPGNGIIYYARGTTNVIEAAPNLTTPVEFVGSTGGTNTLIGGAGDDTLVSVMGNDYLARDDGQHRLRAHPGPRSHAGGLNGHQHHRSQPDAPEHHAQSGQPDRSDRG